MAASLNQSSGQPLTLMAVHAHPDDESSGGGILAAYSDNGIRTVVVTCTNGEFGDAPGGIKPGEDGHDEQAVKILRVSNLETLGYRDSGMEEWAYKADPEAFCNVPLPEVAGRIAALIEEYRPQVLVSYDDAGPYQHPDHVHASRAAQAAAAATGIPAKVYLSTMRGSSWRKIWEALREMGEEVPNFTEDPERSQRAMESEERITTMIDIRPVLSRKREALLTHGSQINDSWFSKLPPEVAEEAFGYEYFIRAADATGAPIPETDLFAGLRDGE